ncbi:hypothetical protein RCL1_006105 [Eukaryota sp. TZLM3-RCL]
MQEPTITPYSFCNFRVIRKIARGAQGETYLVHNEDNVELCAKVLFNGRYEPSPEASIHLKNLNCPYLVSLHDFFTNNEDLVVIMEYCAGGSLQNYLEQTVIPISEKWLIVTQLAHGLHFLHGNNVVHRDLKPGNIFLESYEPLKVKIGDFGFSQDLCRSSAKSMIGTVYFMAPEVLSGKGYDTAVDMWSFGVLIYYLVHGEYPFQTFHEILSSEIPLSDTEFGPLISKLLVRDPLQRATAADVIHHPKIIEFYEDFLKETTLDDVLQLRKELRTLKNIQSDQTDFINQLGTVLSCCVNKISEMDVVICQQSSQLADQESIIAGLVSSFSFIESKVSSSCSGSQDYSRLSGQVEALMPIVDCLKKFEDERSRIKNLCFERKPYTYIISNPGEFFDKFGGQVQFIGTTGHALDFSKNNTVVTRLLTKFRNEPSFIPINHPLNGRIVLRLTSGGEDGEFTSKIGCFDPKTCSSYDQYTNVFVGFELTVRRVALFISTYDSEATTTMYPGNSITIDFTDRHITYTFSHSDYTKRLATRDDLIFGLQMSCKDTTWTIE